MKFLLAMDFDGTVTETDYSVPFFYHFLPNGWNGLDEKYFSGELGRRELYRQIVSMMSGTRAEHEAYIISTGRIRERFEELCTWAEGQGGAVWIVSDGVKVAPEAMLGSRRLPVEIFSNTIRYDDAGKPLDIEPDIPSGDCQWCSNCKRALLAGVDAPVLFIGDGISDVCAVDEADIVFATGMLVDICREKKVGCFIWDDFSQILGWLAEDKTPEEAGLRWQGEPDEREAGLELWRKIRD